MIMIMMVSGIPSKTRTYKSVKEGIRALDNKTDFVYFQFVMFFVLDGRVGVSHHIHHIYARRSVGPDYL